MTEALTSSQLDAGWALSSISCDSNLPLDSSSGDVTSRTATLRVQAGEHVTCTFTNAYTAPQPANGSIQVVKAVTGDDPPPAETFDFDGSIDVDLTGGGSSPVISVAPGTYTVTFTLPGFRAFRREGVTGRFAGYVWIKGDADD